MTQSNLLHTKEVSAENPVKRRNALRVAASVIGAAAMTLLIVLVLAFNSGAWQLYALTLPILMIGIIGAVGLQSIRNGHIERGIWVILIGTMAVQPIVVLLISGLGMMLGIILVIALYFNASQVLTVKELKRVLAASVIVGLLTASTDFLNLPYRLDVPVLKVLAPSITVLTLSAIGFFALRQAWGPISRRFLSFPLRTKFLISVMGTTGLSMLIFGLFVFYRTQRSQTFWSTQMQNTVQHHSRQQTISTTQLEAQTVDETLSRVTYAVEQLANFRAALYTQPSLLGQGDYWNADTDLLTLPSGQYGTTPSDIASVFIPSTVTLDQELITDLNASRYLDFSAPAVLESHPNVVALYFISAENFTVYYPNIDLANNVPPDFDPTAQPFFTIATPENDPERKAMWTEPYQDPAGTGLIVTNALPVYDKNNRFRGVFAADIQLEKISQQVSSLKLGQSGFAFMIDPAGHILAMPDAGYELFNMQPEVVQVNESPKITLLENGPAELQGIIHDMIAGEIDLETAVIQDSQYYVAYAPLPSIGYSIGFVVPRAELDEAYATTQNQIRSETRLTTNFSLLILLVVLLMAGGISTLLARFIADPLVQLTQVATEVSKGNLSARVEAQTTDEVGVLASTFNSMTAQLRDTFATLEQRVAARTHNLELAAEVGHAVSQVRDLDIMLKDACELILKEFSLYYVQVYLSDPGNTTLKLEAGTGNVGAQLVGRGHSLDFNNGSINGRAATEKRSVVISDTAQSATFRKNPLLPETRGEMAVPLIIADTVVGVLDMQSNLPGVLTEDLLPAFEALAGQLAVAIQNANLLAETELARAQVEAQARRLVRAGWNEHLDAIHKPEHLGFVFDHNKVTPLLESDISQVPEDEKTITVPITVTGEPIGSLVIEIADESRREQMGGLINAIARQVAQQIEYLRLLENAERYRHEAERATRLQTIQGWQKYIETRPKESMSYLYDRKEVHPHPNGKGEDGSMFALPLKARDEIIGRVSIQGLAHEDQESVEFVTAIAERLGAHIENLRLFEETRLGHLELDKRARQLAAVAEISTASSQELESDKLLNTVVQLTQRQFGLYHVHVFIYDEATDELQIAACGWRTGDEHEGTRESVSIPMDKEQSLVARAARTRQAVIVNDVKSEPSWLANPLLPDTASEMAVPLLIGDQVLGVLDVQSDRIDAFTEDDANIQATLASQVATAMQNARSFTRAQKQADREAMLNVINQKIQSATSVEAVLQIAARELGHALGAPMTIAQLSMKDNSS